MLLLYYAFKALFYFLLSVYVQGMPLPEVKALCNALMLAQNLSPSPSPFFFRLVYHGIVSEYVLPRDQDPRRGSYT